jgi:hypothetical protein
MLTQSDYNKSSLRDSVSSPSLVRKASEYPNNYIRIAQKKGYIIVFDKDTNSIVKLPNWIITMVENVYFDQ